MRILIALILFLSSCVGPKLGTFIVMDNVQVVYRSFDSKFEFSIDSSICKNHCIIAEGGSIRYLESKKSSQQIGIFKADSISNVASISVYCGCGSDFTLMLQKKYPIHDMPSPDIYFGGINLTDYSISNTVVQFDSIGLIAKYTNNYPLANVNFFIEEWSVTYLGMEIELRDSKSPFVHNSLTDMAIGEIIQLNHVDILFPDGRKSRIYLKREIYKEMGEEGSNFILR